MRVELTCHDIDRLGIRVRSEREQVDVEAAEQFDEIRGAGVGEGEGGAHRYAERPSAERISTRRIEEQPVPPESGGIAHDAADIGRIVDAFSHDEPVASREKSGGRWSCGSVEHGDDRMWHTETGDQPPDLVATDEDVDAEAFGDRWHTVGISEGGEGFTAGFEGPGDHKVTLGEEQPCARVVPFVGSGGEPSLAQSEDGEALVVDRFDADERQRSPRRQKW